VNGGRRKGQLAISKLALLTQPVAFSMVLAKANIDSKMLTGCGFFI